ncbi:MAG TPA: ABC transporter permease [Anaerolineales bacterium]|nr:ABC transporter permease [Anaerolineales bacterium]
MNSIYYILSVAWKEIQVISRERTWLVILFLLPLLIGSFMGGANLAMNQSASNTILLDVGLVNLDAGTFGTEMAKAIQAVEQLQVTVYPGAAEAEDPVAKGKASAAIIIPPDFSQKIDSYTPTTVKVLVDPAEPVAAGIVNGIIQQIVSEFVIWGEVQHGVRTIFDEAGVLASASPQEARAIEAQNLGVVMTRINEMRTNPVIDVVIQDPAGEQTGGTIQTFFAYLFPGLTVMFIFFIVPMSSASLLDERETGTLRRLLTAPIPKGAILAGKTLAYMLLACLQVVVVFAVAGLLFGTPLGKSPLSLVVLTIVVAFTATALGLMVAALAKSVKQAASIGLILAFVLAGLGGAMAMSAQPLYRSGGIMAIISYITPHAHAVEGYYRIMAENAGFIQVLPQMGILLGMGIVIFLVAQWRFRFDQ